MIRRFKRALTGTPFEGPARLALRAVRRLTGHAIPPQPKSWAIRVARDDAHTERLLRTALTRTSNCVDVGAHTGTFLDRFMSLAPEGRHVAFEALPDYAARLTKEFPGVTVHRCALGAVGGRATFCRAVDLPAWSGLRPQPYPSPSRVEWFETDVATLDDRLSPAHVVHFLKVDVEGGELGVFQGAARTITSHLPVILFEHAHIHAESFGTTPAALHDLLVRDYRLRIFSLDGTGPHDRGRFVEICAAAAASNYDEHAQTNFVARPA